MPSPVRRPAPRPREVGCEWTRAPCSRAMLAVRSREPSSTRSTSTGSPHASAGAAARTPPTAASSSRATTTARHRGKASATRAPTSATGVSTGSGRARAPRRGLKQDTCGESPPPSPLPFAGGGATSARTPPPSPLPFAGAGAAPAGNAASTPGSSTGTNGRPRAAFGASTPSSRETVAATSSTERGSREIVPGCAPSPQTTNGTGRSPQSRWPWPPIPRPWPWSAIRITVAPSSLPRASRNARKSPTCPSVSAS